jgi:hypothetical protein
MKANNKRRLAKWIFAGPVWILIMVGYQNCGKFTAVQSHNFAAASEEGEPGPGPGPSPGPWIISSPPDKISMPLKLWVSLPSPTPFAGGTKHVVGAWNPDDYRIYLTGGDYGGFGDSYRQQTYSLSLAERWQDKMNPEAGLRLEYDNCGPARRAPQPDDVQPKHPDFVDWSWDPIKHVFWFIPGEMVVSATNCPGETATSANDPHFLFNRLMTFDPATQKWADMGPANSPFGDQWGGLFDPKSNSIIRFNRGAVDIFDVNQRQWTSNQLTDKRLDRGIVAADFVNRMVYTMDPVEGHLYGYNMDTRALAELGAVPGGPLNDYWGQPMLAWDTHSQVLLWFRYAPGGEDVSKGGLYAYHPDTQQWETLSVVTDEPGVFASGLVMFFDVGQNALVLISREYTAGAQHMFAYRYGDF